MRHGHNMAQIPIKALMTTLLIGVYNPTFDSTPPPVEFQASRSYRHRSSAETRVAQSCCQAARQHWPVQIHVYIH